jgi:pantoate--beta-alanine ligase
MEIVRRVNAMKEISRQLRESGQRIGFVPTMGFLHEGHLTLIRRARDMTDKVVVSIFVNPTQFSPTEDFATYPRDLTRDTDLCIAERVDVLFAPEAEEIYPSGSSTVVEVAGLSTRLEGASRPGHFRGVATVVLKLFEIVKPHVAAFGQKDAQQAIIIQRMIHDLMLDVEMLVIPTRRDDDGVALSSRNVKLAPAERRAARAIPAALQAAEAAVTEGIQDPEQVVQAARRILESEDLVRVDYVELVDTQLLQPVAELTGEMLLAVAVYIGRTRLIDNTVICM